MQIVYKFWEGSWEDGAVLRDRGRGLFARPDKVHRIAHNGTYFQVEAIHANPRPSARRCSTKLARPRADASSLRPTPNACSSTVPQSR